MSLTKQIHIFSIATDAFYEPKEQFYHQRLLKLYKLRSINNPNSWGIQTINRLIKKEKEKLSKILNKRLEDSTPRVLNEKLLNPKSIISLFESSLTRALGIKTNELTENLIILNVFFFQVFKNLVRDGFLLRGERYVFLTASAGQIRTKRAVFIKESEYEKIQKRLMCGLTIRDINDAGGINPN